MTTAAVARHDSTPGLRAAQTEIAELLVLVRQADDPALVREAIDRVRLAREWAKIRKTTAALQRQLCILEIACLQRIATLDATREVLPKHLWAVAKFFAGLQDDQVESLVDQHNSASAIGIYRGVYRAADADAGRAEGRAFAEGVRWADPDELHADLNPDAMQRLDNSIAALIEEVAAAGEPFTIGDLADDLMTRSGGARDAAFREGALQVCRKAIARSPSRRIEIGGVLAPRFVTAFDPRNELFVRIPFENATLMDLADMIARRRIQVDQDLAALRKLEVLHETLTEVDDGECHGLGEMADLVLGDPYKNSGAA